MQAVLLLVISALLGCRASATATAAPAAGPTHSTPPKSPPEPGAPWADGTCTLHGSSPTPWLRDGTKMVWKDNRLVEANGVRFEYGADGLWARTIAPTTRDHFVRDTAGRVVRRVSRGEDFVAEEKRTYDSDGKRILSIERTRKRDGSERSSESRHQWERTASGWTETRVTKLSTADGSVVTSTRVRELDAAMRLLVERSADGTCIHERFVRDDLGRWTRHLQWWDCEKDPMVDEQRTYGDALYESRGTSLRSRLSPEPLVETQHVDERGNLVRIRLVRSDGSVFADTQIEYDGDFRNFACLDVLPGEPGELPETFLYG